MFFSCVVKVCVAVLVLLPLVFTKNLQKLTVRGNYDPGTCAKSNHGELIMVKDREKKDNLLVCTEDRGIYSWKTTDGSKPPGEFFNPGYDCLDILNKNMKAEDGFYWVNFHAALPKRVWCDMTTDGGGYMLIGRANNTETWSVPSNDTTVKPSGPAQWASSFGDVPVLDFRIQVAINDDFKDTKAHWSFRLSAKRALKNLMLLDSGGCVHSAPGIGDISYVKDLQTDEILTKEFKCSPFGEYSHPLAKIGWSMMNSCLKKRCSPGFAFHPKFPVQVDYSGGFSFQVNKNAFSTTPSATAFFGCHKGKCCACYGPLGGTENYCEKGCRAKNGGTVTKNARAWFWIRSNPSARKVWNKCMEYELEEENGDVVWYKLTGDSQIPKRGRCGRNEAVINDGIVVVSDADSFNKIPPVAGLLVYRKDNEEIRVRTNDSWSVIVQEKRLLEPTRSVYFDLLPRDIYHQYPENWCYNPALENELMMEDNLPDYGGRESSSCKLLNQKKPDLPSGYYSIGTSTQVYCDMSNSGWTLIARFSNRDSKNWIGAHNMWYDQVSNYGATDNPGENKDMISKGFWKISGNEIKITRSDDSTHTALLQTTSNCLAGNTFRQKITSYGNFRNEAVWASDKCLGSCRVSYGGQYKSTAGFEEYSCISGIQSSNYIGFWCDWDDGDGAVLMIGGGGSGCRRADHGIGITEADAAKFGGFWNRVDFGHDAEHTPPSSYSLNLWVR